MSEGIPNFQANNLGGAGFQSFAGFGFSLGNLDLFNPNALKPANSEGNSQNQRPKKGKGKIMNKKKGKDLSVSVSEGGPQEVSDFGANDENSNSIGFNNQVMKAPKQIRKQTLQKLQKRFQKPNDLSGRNADRDRFSNSNRGRFNRGPPKAVNSGMFFKTKICPHFIEGNCRRGDACNYAHSQNELHIVPNLKKTKICQLYQIGKCNMGNACSFAHGDQELRSTPEFFKTSLCHAFLKGTCKAGEGCRYAHGDSELRSGPVPLNHSPLPMKNLNNNNPAGFNLSFQPQSQPQPEQFNPPQMYQNYSLPPSNFGFDHMAFQPFINQQQPPSNNTVVNQEPLPEIKFGSFDPSKLGALWNPNSNNMNFYN